MLNLGRTREEALPVLPGQQATPREDTVSERTDLLRLKSAEEVAAELYQPDLGGSGVGPIPQGPSSRTAEVMTSDSADIHKPGQDSNGTAA